MIMIIECFVMILEVVLDVVGCMWVKVDWVCCDFWCVVVVEEVVVK